MKKVTLRKTEQGIIAIVDEKLIGEVLYSTHTNTIGEPFTKEQVEYASSLSNIKSILASTFGVGMELWWERGGLKQNANNLHERFLNYFNFNAEYEYTIDKNRLIIKQ